MACVWSDSEFEYKFVRVLDVQKAELDEWINYWTPLKEKITSYEERRTQDHPTRVEESKRESREIRSSLLNIPMFGVTKIALNLYGLEEQLPSTGLCVPEYLSRHLKNRFGSSIAPCVHGQRVFGKGKKPYTT